MSGWQEERRESKDQQVLKRMYLLSIQEIMACTTHLCPHMLDAKARQAHLHSSPRASMLAAFLDLAALTTIFVSVCVCAGRLMQTYKRSSNSHSLALVCNSA